MDKRPPLKVKVDVELVRMALKFPCHLAFSLQYNLNRLSSDVLYELVNGECLTFQSEKSFPHMLSQQKKGLSFQFEITEAPSTCILLVSVVSKNGQLLGGSATFDVQDRNVRQQNTTQFIRVLKLQNCPDKYAEAFLKISAIQNKPTPIIEKTNLIRGSYEFGFSQSQQVKVPKSTSLLHSQFHRRSRQLSLSDTKWTGMQLEQGVSIIKEQMHQSARTLRNYKTKINELEKQIEEAKIMEMQNISRNKGTELQIKEQITQLQSKKKEIQTKSKELMQLEIKIQETNVESGEKSKKNENRNKYIELKEKELKEKSQELAYKQIQLNKKNTELEQKVRQVEKKNKQLKERNQGLEEKNLVLKQREMEIKHKNEGLENKNSELLENQRQLIKKDRELEEKNRELQQKSRELKLINSQLVDKNRELEQKSGEIQEKSKEIESKDRELQQRNKKMQSKDQKLQNKDIQLKGINRELEGINRELGEKNKELASKNLELLQMSLEIEKRDRELRQRSEKTILDNEQLSEKNNALQIVMKEGREAYVQYELTVNELKKEYSMAFHSYELKRNAEVQSYDTIIANMKAVMKDLKEKANSERMEGIKKDRKIIELTKALKECYQAWQIEWINLNQ